MEAKHVQISLPSHLYFSSAVRGFANAVFGAAGFAEAWCHRLELVVDELFMNAVMYGSNDESQVYLSFSYTPEEIEFTLEDEGTGQNKMTAENLKEKVRQNAANRSLTKTCGRGLALITHVWTDTFEIEPSPHGGIRIRCRKTVDTHPPPSLSPSPQAPPLLATAAPVRPSAPAAASALDSAPSVALKNANTLAQIDALDILVKEKIALLSCDRWLVLDFSDVEYINSTFIAYLASWYNDAQAKGGHLALHHMNERIRDVLTLVGLNQIFSFDS